MTKNIKVLMVDDELQFRATTKKILERRGFATIMAASGEEALGRLKEEPDVVILDVKMTGMDGHETLAEIKKRQPDLPVIMLTGHGAVPSAEEALITGAFDYLTKPCDMDLLSSKIVEAAHSGKKEVKTGEEKQVTAVMIPIAEYTTLKSSQSISQAMKELKASFTSKLSTNRLMETGHRSILVINANDDVEGIVAISDLIEALMPGYLTAPKPSTADSIQYSPMFWSGMFTQQVKNLAKIKVGHLMSPVPPSINGNSSLMGAAYMMYQKKTQRLIVTDGKKVIGVIREQDLFFEMEKIIRMS